MAEPAHHAPKIDDNNPAADALSATLFVVLPFFVAIAIGLVVLGGVSLPGMGGGDAHHAEAGH